MNNLRIRTAQKVEQLRKQIDPTPYVGDFSTLLSELFDLGGVVSGGAVISVINNRPIKDVDFYFNDEESYIKACNLSDKRVDICWYFDRPYELHDMSYVMCSMTRDKINITEEAQMAFDTNVSELFINNIVYPERTVKRMLKYNQKYGVKFKLPQVLAFSAIYNISKDDFLTLSQISI